MGMGLGCWAIVIVLAIYTVLGFFLAWIAQMVAREEVEVKTGVITLVCSGVVSLLVRVGIYQIDSGPAGVGAGIVAELGVLTLMIHLIAKLSWKHSIIISLIYTVLLAGVMFGLSSCS